MTILRLFFALTLATLLWGANAPSSMPLAIAPAIAADAPEVAPQGNPPAQAAPAARPDAPAQAGDAPARTRGAWYVNPFVLAIGIGGLALVIALIAMGSRTTDTTVIHDRRV